MKRPADAAPATPAIHLTPGEEKLLTSFLAAGALPAPLEKGIEDYIARKTGRALDDPVVLERLRRAVIAQKDDYWQPSGQRRLQYTKGYRVFGYLAYHFPVYFMQTEYLLAMLARDGLLKEKMAILDIGTGPGIVPFAIADFWSRLAHATADVFSMEQSEEHIEAFLYLRERFVPRGGTVSVKPPVHADITDPVFGRIPRIPDLIVFSNVLNEVFSGDTGLQADLVLKYAGLLAPDGTILLAEPAEERASTQLRVLSLALKRQGLTIHSPCSFVHGTNCTPDRCWSFSTAPSIRPTRLMKKLAGAGEPYRFLNTDIKFSYVVLRKDAATRYGIRIPSDTTFPRLSRIRQQTGQRIRVIAAKMSENLGNTKTRVFLLCDGSSGTPVYAVLPAYHITPANRAIIGAGYGEILELVDVLVRFNPKHDAWNLLVNRNSRVIPVNDKFTEEKN